MFSNFGFMLKTNLFCLAKASNPGKVKHPLEKHIISSFICSWSAGVTESYVPTMP